MMYKDKALQRETTRLRVRRYRSNKKALQGIQEMPCNPIIIKEEALDDMADAVALGGGIPPVYQQGKQYAPGTKVVYQGKIVTIPELDADGYLME